MTVANAGKALCLSRERRKTPRHSPIHIAPERHDKILHTRLIVGDNVLMGSDAPPERYEKPQGFFVTLGVDTPAEAERIFKALSEKGTLHMPLQETFWAVRFGMLVDQFDIPWMINCEKAAGAPSRT